MDAPALELECQTRCWSSMTLQSAAPDRGIYLRRPDLGRSLSPLSREHLETCPGPFDLALIIADGLSALAVHRHALELCSHLLNLLYRADWKCSPILLVQQGRVAIGDEIGEILQAAMSLVLIGERPGLSAADSLGAYLTWHPQLGRTDAERNCVSNIRPTGLDYDAAAKRTFLLLTAARTRQRTGYPY